MKYLDKVLFESPYPIVYDGQGNLFVMLGKAIFEYTEKETSAIVIKNCQASILKQTEFPPLEDFKEVPILKPAGRRSYGIGIAPSGYNNIMCFEDVNMLCLQHESIPLSVIGRYYEYIDESLSDHLFTSIKDILCDEDITVQVPSDKVLTLPLNYDIELLELQTSLQLSENKFGIYFHAYLEEQNDFKGCLITFVKQAFALDYLFNTKGFYHPDYNFTLSSCSSFPEWFNVSKFNELFSALLSAKRLKEDWNNIKFDIFMHCSEISFKHDMVKVLNDDETILSSLFSCSEFDAQYIWDHFYRNKYYSFVSFLSLLRFVAESKLFLFKKDEEGVLLQYSGMDSKFNLVTCSIRDREKNVSDRIHEFINE